MYTFLDAALARATVGAPERAWSWPDLGPNGHASWRSWLRDTMQVDGFLAALEQASPVLARRVCEICEGRPVPEPDVRRVVLSVMRYLLRASGRATPFGLFVGVAPARVTASPAAAAGAADRAAARPQAEWLTAIIERLEAEPALLPRLMVVANNLAVERDGYLTLEHRPTRSSRGAPTTMRMRATPPVRAAMDLAAEAIGVAVLAAKLAANFSRVPAQVIDALLASLVKQGLLLTHLRPAMTGTDPLRHVVTAIEALDAMHVPVVAETAPQLRQLADQLAHRQTKPTSVPARAHRARLARVMASVSPTPPRPALCVDLRLDGRVEVPRMVAEEVERAACALVRLARRPHLDGAWATWHGRFLERYGPRAVVPLLEAVDAGIGLGYPAGFLGAAAAPAGEALADRDTKLLKLAQDAALRRQREVWLDDATIDDLSVLPPDAPVQPTTELTVRISAKTEAALAQGEFSLTVIGVSRAAGTTTGRFLHLLDPHDQARMAAVYANAPTACRDALAAQISAAPLYAKAEDIGRAPQVLPYRLPVGEYHDGGQSLMRLDDLAVTADARRIYLISRSRGRVVEPVLVNAVEPIRHLHPLARFLLQVTHALSVPCSDFSWGAAGRLPFLPAVGYGRTILCPARWQLASADLPGRTASWEDWDRALSAWGEQVALPRRVYLGESDQCLRLDLTVPAHRMLLRTQLDRDHSAYLRAVPDDEDAGWIGGRAHEVVIPLASRAAPADPPTWLGGHVVAGRDHGHLPGCDGRIYLKLYGPHPDTVITRHLPGLLEKLDEQAQWWFLRYRDPEEHLRLRLRVPLDRYAATVAQVGAWTTRVRAAGLAAHVAWDTYFPETARFGGEAAMRAAEGYFAADSAAALALLRASGAKDGADVRALTAASMLDIAVGVVGSAADGMNWLIEHARASGPAPARAVYDQAVALANPTDHAHLAGQPHGGDITGCWASRRRAAETYRDALQQAGTRQLITLLPDLLHLHHARMIGTDPEDERACLRLARAAALSWTAREARTS